jgi:hypothetical protein
MVPKAGVEPASPYEDKILSLACMPIPPLGHESVAYTHSEIALVNQMDVPAQFGVDEWGKDRLQTTGYGRYRPQNLAATSQYHPVVRSL